MITLNWEKGFFPTNTEISLKKLKKVCQAKIKFYNLLSNHEIGGHERLSWFVSKTDVLLLADVFEHFREVSINYFELDSDHCLSNPGFIWYAMLRFSGVNVN